MKNRWQPIALGILISGIALFFLLRQLNIADLVDIVRNARFEYIILTIFLTSGLTLIRGWRWQVLTDNRLSIMDGFWLFNIGFLFNNVLPARLGEFARAYLAGRRQDLEFSSALSTIIVERLFDMVSVVVMFGIVLIGLDLPRLATAAGLIMGSLAVAGIIVLALVARFPESSLSLSRKVADRIPGLSGESAVSFLSPFITGLSGVSKLRIFLAGLFLSIVAWVLSGLVGWVLMHAFWDSMPIMMGQLAIAAAGVGIAVPAAPSGLGPYEAAVTGVLTAMNYPIEVSSTYAFTLHFASIVATSILGMLGLLREGVRFSEVADAARSLRQIPGGTSAEQEAAPTV